MAIEKKKAPDIGDLLARARAVAPELGKATDRLNESLTSVEKGLAGLRLGVSADVYLPTDQETDHPDYFRCISFRKEDQNWRLMYESGIADGDGPVEAVPLVNASRALRVEAVGYLTQLVEQLVATAQKQAEEVRAKADEADKLADVLSNSERGGAK